MINSQSGIVPFMIGLNEHGIITPESIKAIGHNRKKSIVIRKFKSTRLYYIYDCDHPDCLSLVFTGYKRKYCPECNRVLKLLLMAKLR